MRANVLVVCVVVVVTAAAAAAVVDVCFITFVVSWWSWILFSFFVVVSNILLYSNFSSLLLLPLLFFLLFCVSILNFCDVVCWFVVYECGFFAYRWSSIKLLQYFYSTFNAQYGILCIYIQTHWTKEKQNIQERTSKI